MDIASRLAPVIHLSGGVFASEVALSDTPTALADRFWNALCYARPHAFTLHLVLQHCKVVRVSINLLRVCARTLACTPDRSCGNGLQHYVDIASRLAPVIHLSGGWPRWPAPHSRGTLNPKSTWLGYWWGGIEMQSKCALAPPTTQTKPTFLFGWVVRRTASVKP